MEESEAWPQEPEQEISLLIGKLACIALLQFRKCFAQSRHSHGAIPPPPSAQYVDGSTHLIDDGALSHTALYVRH